MEGLPESMNQDPEEGIQYEEDVKIFESKYDNEFLGLLNEIGIRLTNFNKHDKLKIKSWINLLTIPCDTNETKKNRNLYAIKLINQMINGKLEEPFTKHANGLNDLKWLSPIDIKAELTKKFYEEIDFEKIESYGIQQQKNFLNNHPDIANKIKFQNNTKNNMTEYNIGFNNNNYLNNINNNNFNNIEYYDDNNLNEKPFYTDGNYFGNNNKFNRGGSNKNKEFKVINNKINNSKIYNDKVKLINIIRDLEQKVIERDEIIEFQNKQIEQIRNRISFIQNLQNNNNANYGQ